jgi:hypothetical protein
MNTMSKTLTEVLRETRAKIHAGTKTLDLLGRPVAEVEDDYRLIFEDARRGRDYWQNRITQS